MAYDYPSEKLSIYLSDDAGSVLTFYALHEASEFAKVWLPFCRRYKIEPRSPAAYFSHVDAVSDICTTKEWYYVKVVSVYITKYMCILNCFHFYISGKENNTSFYSFRSCMKTW